MDDIFDPYFYANYRHAGILRQHPIDSLDDNEFASRYRFSKEAVENLLIIIGDLDSAYDQRDTDLSGIEKLCVALRFYASGSFQSINGDLVGIHQTTVSRIVDRVSTAIIEQMPRFIAFPPDLNEIKHGFMDYSRIPSIIGAIDGTHIPIISPGGDNAELFRCRKGYFSINVQCVCDSKGNFTDIVCRWPGATHDATIFENSRLCHRLENNVLNGLLLGDSAYPCRRYLLTPVLNPVNLMERRYNTSHIRTRNVIERTYGQWKQRFRCLKMLRTTRPLSQKIIVATACLHNYAKSLQLPMDNDFEAYDMENEIFDNRNYLRNAFRQEIILQYFNY